MPGRPNLVLICVDQWRGDCLSIDDHPVVHTPFLDRIALDGVRFSRAYSATPSCIAARAALFTGLGQRTHGRVGYRDGVAWDYPRTLAGELTAAGYQTQAVGKMHVYPERSQVGFQSVTLHDGYLHFARRRHRPYEQVDDYLPWLRERVGREADYAEHGLDCNGVPARPWPLDEHLHPTTWVATHSIDFLRRRDPRKPFFLFMSFHRPHPPYDPPGWAFDMYRDREMGPRPVGDWASVFEAYHDPRRPDASAGRIDPSVLRRALAGYYGHMTHIDHQVGRFMEALGEYGLAGDTRVCFVSDHGELLGDHHLLRKSLPYEGSARVPCILWGVPGAGRGTVCSEVVELRDVMPTLLECAGAPVPAALEGRSLLPFARGEKPPWRPYLHGEHAAFGQSIQWIVDGRWKYVWLSEEGREQLFDLHGDPAELHDRSASPDAVEHLARLRASLVGELDGREEGYVERGRLVAGRPPRQVLSHLPARAARTGE